MDNKRKIKKSDINIIRWIFNVCRAQIPAVIFIIIFNVVQGVTSVLFANFSKNVIDGATVHGEMKYVVKYALMLLGVVCLQLTINIVRNSIAERCKARLDVIFRSYILDKIMKKDYASVTKYHTGELQNRIFNDVNVVTDGFTKFCQILFTFLQG